MASPVVIIGSNGQLGSDLMRLWPAQYGELVGLTHQDIEVTSMDSVRAKLEAIRPKLVVNTSAYHKVDDVESNPEKAFLVNAIGPRSLALGCRELDAILIHISTDYVFGGRKSSPYVESDPVDPANVYGVSKAAGEMLVRSLWKKHFIVRTTGLYGISGPSGKGTNFIELMIRLANAGKPIKVVDDQIMTPTPTRALAAQIALLSGTEEFGTYHATCQGQCSWYEFDRTIFELSGLSPQLSTQTTAQSGAIATRPAYSVLENSNLAFLGIDRMPPWEAGLKEYLDLKKKSVLSAGN
jgi:dTDP-4-dehydrorhamnose reductase